jgi:uncharacterized protein (DUF1499 family)
MTDDTPAATPTRGGRPLAVLALVAGAVAFVMVVAAGPGTRFGVWTFRTAFGTLFRYGAYLGIAAAVLALVAILVVRRTAGRGAVAMAAMGLLLGALAFYFPWSFMHHAGKVPSIHDVTTDFTNPPELTYSRALRDSLQGTMNGWQYEGDSIARLQRKAYPDIRPVMLAMNPDEAYRAAMNVARQMGWEITVNDPATRRIEAVDETPWFGFKDDVSVRVTPASGVSRVDVRSVSRVGRGDVGMNAARVRKYVARLRDQYKRQLAETQ